MNIEGRIETHILAGVASAYPNLDPDQVMVKMPFGDFEYARNKGRACIGSEKITAHVVVDTADPLDRRPIIRAFPRREIDLGDGYRVFQQYTRHEYHDYVEAVRMKRIVFFIQFIYDVMEA